MLCTKILVAYDNSDLAQKSLEKAIDIAKTNPGIEIQVVHVIAMPSIVHSEMGNFQALDAIYQSGKDFLSEVKLKLSEIPNPSRTFLLEGEIPAYVILKHANENNCDLIIMGCRGLSGIKEFLGSVSRTIVQRSKIPVLIIK